MSVILEKIKVGGKIVDVRTPEEFGEEHYPNALNISVEEVESRLDEFGEKGNPVIVYCATGARSAYAARILRQCGFKDVTNAGGLGDMPDVWVESQEH